MNCPECGSKMERESFREVAMVANPGSFGENPINSPPSNGILGTHVTQFYCAVCDSEWVKRGRGEIYPVDVSGSVPVDCVVKYENYH
jgi:hypothetical protein